MLVEWRAKSISMGREAIVSLRVASVLPAELKENGIA